MNNIIAIYSVTTVQKLEVRLTELLLSNEIFDFLQVHFQDGENRPNLHRF